MRIYPKHHKSKKSKVSKKVRAEVKSELMLLSEQKQFSTPIEFGMAFGMTYGSWTIDALFNPLDIKQGPSDSERIASKIRIKELYLSQVVAFLGDYAIGNSEPESVGLRTLVCQLKKNATRSQLGIALQAGPDYGASGAPFGLCDNVQHNDKIKQLAHVLYDKVHVMQPSSQLMFIDTTLGTPNVVTKIVHTPFAIKHKIKPKIKNIEWVPNTGTGSPDFAGDICMFYYSIRIGYTSSTAVNNPVFYKPGWQTNYEDF